MCQTQRFWEILCEKIGRPELTRDPAYRDREARHANRDRLTCVLDETLSARTTAEWLEVMGGAVPCAPVYDLPQALDNPFHLEREGIQRLDHPDHDGLKVVASPIRMGAKAPARAGAQARPGYPGDPGGAGLRPGGDRRSARPGRDLRWPLSGGVSLSHG